MLGYIERNLNRFDEEKVNDVDILILAWFSYLSLDMYEDGIRLRDVYLAEFFQGMLQTIKDRDNSLKLLARAAASPRFRDILIKDYESILNDDVQFAAVTYILEPGLNVISFRGTDNSFAGWKEDLDLSLTEPIPSQVMAAEYLQKHMEELDGEIIVCGHSKGGNLAVYASANISRELQDRITRIYSFDGPGFLTSEFDEGFLRIRNRITKVIPQSSLVGMLFDSECELKIVRSSSVSIAQHNPMLWKVRDGEFELRKELTPDAKIANRSFNKWIYSLTLEERDRFITTIFGVLDETGVDDFEVLIEDIYKYLPAISKKIFKMDKGTRKFMLNCFFRLAESGITSVPELLIEEFGRQE